MAMQRTAPQPVLHRPGAGARPTPVAPNPRQLEGRHRHSGRRFDWETHLTWNNAGAIPAVALPRLSPGQRRRSCRRHCLPCAGGAGAVVPDAGLHRRLPLEPRRSRPPHRPQCRLLGTPVGFNPRGAPSSPPGPGQPRLGRCSQFRRLRLGRNRVYVESGSRA